MTQAPPERHKSREEWSVDEIVKHDGTGEMPEADERAAAHREHLTAGGLEADDRQAEKPLEEMTAEDHSNRIRRNG